MCGTAGASSIWLLFVFNFVMREWQSRKYILWVMFLINFLLITTESVGVSVNILQYICKQVENYSNFISSHRKHLAFKNTTRKFIAAQFVTTIFN
jgi:hypothetical protein